MPKRRLLLGNQLYVKKQGHTLLLASPATPPPPFNAVAN
jgi:hypothetical protein